ncbi:MAG: response regulator [Proteobacteria bacterium]|nr:response regulator [Pseudomonadota bacterium]
MGNFNNLSIQFKATFASALLLACLLGLGAHAYLTSFRSAAGLHVLSSELVPKQEAFSDVGAAVVATHMKIFRYVSWASNGLGPDVLKPLEDEIVLELNALSAHIEALTRRPDLSEQERDALQVLVAKWRDCRAQALDTIDVGRTDAPMATMMIGQTDDSFEAVDADLRKMTQAMVAHATALQSQLSAQAQRNRQVVVWVVLLGLLISIGVAMMISRSIVRPIRQITSVMQRLSAGQTQVELDHGVRRDEIGKMADAIEIFRTHIIDNARLFKQIQEKSEQLEAASEHKSQFLANMSHELRTPMNAIIGVSEMLLEDARDLNRTDDIEPLERILRAAQHLLALINDILDLSKIEAGKMELNIESFAVEPLVQDVVATVLPIARKNGNDVKLECADGIGVLTADPMRLRQALLNLASNAAKFSERGTITIRALRRSTEGREWVDLEVTDTGIGMTPEQVSRLFQEFVQADASTTRKYGGTGLGLAISQSFCRMMGGEISVRSELGRGSTFTIHLPAEPAQQAGLAAHGRGPAVSAASAVSAVSAGASSAQQRTVLVIDDDPTVRQLMERHLVREGFQVVTADSGAAGIARAKELHPSAITLDIMMPDIDGWTVLAALKGDPRLEDIPVVLVTIVDEKQRGYTLGATDYLIKPVNRERLASTLRTICRRSGGQLLVVDDDEPARMLVRHGMEREGWQVMEAANGRLALQAVQACEPDAIVLDLMMPEMDGFEFLAELRRRAGWRDIPVVVVTALDLSGEEHRRLNGFVASVIHKSGQHREQLLHEVSARLASLTIREEDASALEPAA